MTAARILSILLHPILMPLAGILLMFRTASWLYLMPTGAQRYLYLVVVTLTILVPLTAMPLLKRRGMISSYSLDIASERRIPLLIGSFFYMMAAFILHKVNAPVIIPLFLNASALVVLFCAMLTYRWKVSNHMAALGGLAGMVLAVSLRWMTDGSTILAILFILAGVAGWARLKLNAHRPLDIYGGYLLGFAVTFVLIRFF